MEPRATLHIVPVKNNVLLEMTREEEQVLADDVTKKIVSGEIVLPGLKRGDVVIVEDNDTHNYYFFDGKKVIPQTDLFEGFAGEIPEELYWPEFPVDYWNDLIIQNNFVPVRIKERYIFKPEDVKLFHLVTEAIEIDVPYVEIDNLMIILQVDDNNDCYDHCDLVHLVGEINDARHVDVVYPGMNLTDDWLDIGSDPWKAHHDDFETDKIILIVIPEDMYMKD